jgi:hypothetical protein
MKRKLILEIETDIPDRAWLCDVVSPLLKQYAEILTAEKNMPFSGVTVTSKPYVNFVSPEGYEAVMKIEHIKEGESCLCELMKRDGKGDFQ